MLILRLFSHKAEVSVLSPLECAVTKKGGGRVCLCVSSPAPTSLPLCFGLCMFCVDGGAEDAEFVGGGQDFEAAALERAHFHHFVDQAVEQSYINEFGFRAGDEKHAGTTHVDA